MKANRQPEVAILLSTYNGSVYLEEFLNSLGKQTYRDFLLIIRDDGSTDSTISIINKYSESNPNYILIESGKNIGIKKSFSKLLSYAYQMKEINYFMFADQDDVWLPTKVETSIIRMRNLEVLHKQPLLIHTDLKVVDRNLNLISNSFFKFQSLDPRKDRLNNLLMQNIVTGCTVIMNRLLIDRCHEVPEEAIMHDWWLALNASVYGSIHLIEEASMLYRQHGQNSVGAKQLSIKYIMNRLSDKFSITDNIIQAATFYEKNKRYIKSDQKLLLEQFIKLGERKHRFLRLQIIIKNKFYKSGFVRNVGLILLSFKK